MHSTIAHSRAGHIVRDTASRIKKAVKIEQLLGIASSDKPLNLLDIGTGSGIIAHYFANLTRLNFEVHAVDLQDSRILEDGYTFTMIEGIALPYSPATFDIVLSNHVLEHVGTHKEQLQHLREIRRVLKSDGIGYVAVPSRWMIVEPHYRLPFLSWLPRPLRHAYVRVMRKARFYDCEPPGPIELERMFRASGLKFQNQFTEAVHAMFDIEKEGSPFYRVVNMLPDRFISRFSYLSPTLIYLVRPI